MSLREVCVASTERVARVHELNATPSFSKCDFDIMSFNDGQCHDNFNIQLVNRYVDVDISRDRPSNCSRHISVWRH
jgi:hypothetical protein